MLFARLCTFQIIILVDSLSEASTVTIVDGSIQKDHVTLKIQSKPGQ